MSLSAVIKYIYHCRAKINLGLWRKHTHPHITHKDSWVTGHRDVLYARCVSIYCIDIIIILPSIVLNATLLPCAPNNAHPDHWGGGQTAAVALPAPLIPSITPRTLQLLTLEDPDGIQVGMGVRAYISFYKKARPSL